MKRVLSVILSVTLMVSVICVAALITAQAGTENDDTTKTYKTLFDADSDENAVTYTGWGLKDGSLGITDADGLPYNTETGSSKLLKYMTAGAYFNPQVTFSGDIVNELVQNSIGVRIWVAADKESEHGGRSGIMFQFYDSVNDKTYSSSLWGNTLTSLETKGKWYTLYWDDFSTASIKLAVGAGAGTVSANSIYKNITKIIVASGINSNGSWASLVDNNIYIDDLQFIYAGSSGDAETTLPSSSEASTTASTTAAPSTAETTTVAPTTTAAPTTQQTTAAPTTTAVPTTVVTTVAPTTTIALTTDAPTTTVAPVTTVVPTTTALPTTAATTAEPTTIKPIIYGDANGDGTVNMLDLIEMRKYLAKWSIGVDEAAADCNADGKINLPDLILIRKYIEKWNVSVEK